MICLAERVKSIPYSEFYEAGGTQVSFGGYSKPSKRWKTLTLSGMYALSGVEFSIAKRKARTIGDYNLPECYMVKITPKWQIEETPQA